MMKSTEDTKSNSGIMLVLVVVGLVYAIYIYLLTIQDQFGYIAAGGFFILFSAEHVFNFVGRTSLGINKYSGTNYQKAIAFSLPAALVIIAWLIISGI